MAAVASVEYSSQTDLYTLVTTAGAQFMHSPSDRSETAVGDLVAGGAVATLIECLTVSCAAMVWANQGVGAEMAIVNSGNILSSLTSLYTGISFGSLFIWAWGVFEALELNQSEVVVRVTGQDIWAVRASEQASKRASGWLACGVTASLSRLWSMASLLKPAAIPSFRRLQASASCSTNTIRSAAVFKGGDP